ELLARGGGFAQQLLGGETVLAQETIQRGGGQCRLLLPLGGSALPQQRRAGLRIDDTRLAPILPRLGREPFQAIAPVTQRPVQQCVNGNRAPGGVWDVVGTRGDFLGASCEFAARQ